MLSRSVPRRSITLFHKALRRGLRTEISEAHFNLSKSSVDPNKAGRMKIWHCFLSFSLSSWLYPHLSFSFLFRAVVRARARWPFGWTVRYVELIEQTHKTYEAECILSMGMGYLYLRINDHLNGLHQISQPQVPTGNWHICPAIVGLLD